jgi:hypothetical protein
MFRAIAIALGALFLASVARFYHPGFGFTALLGMPEGHSYELPAMRAIPHVDYPPSASYDGQFYAQLALEPLLRNPDIDRALDQPPYRARRILLSWTAWVLGLGRPAWVIEAFALQNVLCWILLAMLTTRWLPLTSARNLALWTACLFAHGLLWSVRFSLVDGPSLLFLACIVWAAESSRPLLSALVTGIAALARETSLLGLLAQPRPRNVRGLVRLALAIALAVLPLLIWQDYLFSIYRAGSLSDQNRFTIPFAAYAHALRRAALVLWYDPGTLAAVLPFLVFIAFTVEAVSLVVRPRPSVAWWRLATAYAGIMVMLDPTLWNIGSLTRIVLPMTYGFNVMLARHTGRGFWVWYALGNLQLVGSLALGFGL